MALRAKPSTYEPKSDDGNPAKPTSATARARATLKDRGGFRDRRVGGWSGVPAEDSAEPFRTERLLAHPFRIFHERVGDGWEAREGFLLFRVNGTHCIGASYRLFVLVINMLFGVLSGMQPVLTTGSPAAFAQAAIVLALQLLMAFVCCRATPDADRVVSTYAGMQFVFESLATACLLYASSLGAADTPVPAMTAAQRPWLLAAFWMGLLAIFVPMTQLLEQRLVTPAIVLVEKGNGNPLQIAAQLYMLVISLPRRIMTIVSTIAGMDTMTASDAGASASADAGDEADANDGGDQADAQLYSADQAVEQVAKASKLLARATAAKEVSSKSLVMQAPKPDVTDEKGGSQPKPAEMASLTEELEVDSGGAGSLASHRSQIMAAGTMRNLHGRVADEEDAGGLRNAADDADDDADMGGDDAGGD